MEATLQVKFVALTDVGRVRAANEDNHGHAEFPWGQVYVVCDGMGGHVGGARASHIAVTSILEYLARDNAKNPANSLEEAISFANEQIYATSQVQRELKGMGTTCVVLLQKETGLWLAHVGDSRAYIYTDGKLFKLSRDHSFVQGLVDLGSIAEEDAESHPRKNELMRALGVSSTVEVEVTAEPIFPKKGDLFLLCSDGLYGMTGDTGIQKVLAAAGTLEQKAQLLIDEANEGGGTDNITVQMIHVLESPHVVNRYTAIKPPIHLGRTMPVEQNLTQNLNSLPQEVPFLKRYMIPLVFGGVFLIAAGILVMGMMNSANQKAAVEKRNQEIEDSTAEDRKQDSLKTIADTLAAVSLRKANAALAHEDSIKKKLIKPDKKSK